MKKLCLTTILAIVSLTLSGCANFKYVKVARTMMKTQQELEKEEYDQAIKRLTKLKKAHPGIRWVDLSLAEAYEKKGDYVKAEALLKGLERDEGLSFEVHLKKAGLYLAWDKKEEAEKAFGIVRKRGAIEVEQTIARIYEEQKQYDEALRIYTGLKEEHPSYFLADTDLGNIYRKKGQAVEAIESYQDALNFNPQNVETLMWLSGLYLMTGQAEKAEGTLEKVLSIPEGKKETRLLVRAILDYLNSSSYKEARQSDIAKEELSAGRLNEAAEIYQKALGRFPADSRLHLNLGGIYLLKEMNKEAIKELEKVKGGDEARVAKALIKEVLNR
ncbi:tetratricopeptide repeat protein [bacterium]|nr:tetratricopeptide repeat protein [bacterium]MBU1614495.1 tetratricopeptide repeat protein [bacterium]